MKALVFHGPGEKSWQDVPDPHIQAPTDVIVQIDTTTICGTDLHILKGDVPAVQPGRILGHEGVGTITEVGDAVTTLAVGDRVIISCIKSCGKCVFCKQGLYSHCLGDEGASGIGWVFGHLIDGTQAEYVRVPYAENSLYKIPDGVPDEHGVMLSDILPHRIRNRRALRCGKTRRCRGRCRSWPSRTGGNHDRGTSGRRQGHRHRFGCEPSRTSSQVRRHR